MARTPGMVRNFGITRGQSLAMPARSTLVGRNGAKLPSAGVLADYPRARRADPMDRSITTRTSATAMNTTKKPAMLIRPSWYPS